MSTEDNMWSAGTGRRMRFTPALDPDTVQPFNQTTEAFLQEAKTYATWLQYFNERNEPEGDWSALLGDADLIEMARFLDDPGSVSKAQRDLFSRPHLALFLSFLGLLRHAQEEYNGLPKRHLDYYYRQVLLQNPNPAQPDKVHVLFSLKDKVSQYLLPSGSRLNAGPDDTGKQLIYTTDQSIVINNAKLVDLKNIFRSNADGLLYAATAPGQVTAQQVPGVDPVPWKTFGQATQGNDIRSGLIVASPLLMLSEGARTIALTINFSQYDEGTHQELFNDIEVFLSTAGGFVGCSPDVIITKVDTSKVSVAVSISLDVNFVAIAPLGEETDGPDVSAWPVMELVWSDARTFVGLKMDDFSIKVDVTGITDLMAENTSGIIDTSKPFQPFTDTPYVGSELILAHPELVAKRPQSISVGLNWVGSLPVPEDYYQTYWEVDHAPVAGTTATDISDYVKDVGKVTLELLEPGQAGSSSLPLVKLSGSISVAPPVVTTSLPAGPPDEIDKYDLNKYRRLKMTLAGTGYLLEKYAPLEAKRTTLAAGESPTVTATTTSGQTSYVVTGLTWTKKSLSQPYVPKLKSISLDYSASAEWTSESEQVQLFALYPFGYTGPHSPDEIMSLNEGTNTEGELFIGIDKLQPPQNLSLLLQLSEGSADPEAPAAQITWSYLKDNKWITANENTSSGPLVLADDTNGLLQSGVIQFAIPSGVTTDATLMPAGLFWLRASAAQKNVAETSDIQCTRSVSDILAVYPQAVKATFQNNGNSASHFDQPLSPSGITGLIETIPDIDKVLQPFTSFGGRAAENDSAFYTRVSERLRHKNRALSMWDYERLVLENFPEIYKVKCNRADKEPGSVTLTVIPDIRLHYPFAPFEPKAPVSTLRAIEEFLQKKAPAYINITVKNPVYNTVQLYFSVKFMTGYDPGYYMNVLQEDIRRYLSPWAYEEGTDIEFDQTIYSGSISYFIDKQPYVNFISGLGLQQLDEDGLPVTTGQVSTSLHTQDQNSIWVSARDHLITIIDTDVPDYGIGAMRVQYDFMLAQL